MNIKLLCSISCAVAVGGLSYAIPASAVTLVLDDTNSNLVVGINDLEIDGFGTYNVDFVFGSFNEIFDPTGSGPIRKVPTFLDSQAGASAAFDAIAAALNSESNKETSNTFGPYDTFFVPFAYSASSDTFTTYYDANWVTQVDISDTLTRTAGQHPEQPATPFATFSTSEPVPEPLTILGSGAALAMGYVARRRKLSQQDNA